MTTFIYIYLDAESEVDDVCSACNNLHVDNNWVVRYMVVTLGIPLDVLA